MLREDGVEITGVHGVGPALDQVAEMRRSSSMSVSSHLAAHSKRSTPSL